MPKVSIIVPVFNGSGYIERNTRYILEQDHRDIEVIFVADKRSTDDTVRKIESVLPKYHDAVVVEQTEGGLGQARNIGLEYVTGDLIWFLDVDDHPLPDFLSTLVDAQLEHDADVVFCNYIRSSETDPVIKNRKNGIKVMSRYEAMTARGKNKIPVTSWSMITKTDVIMRNGLRFIPTGYAEDIDFTYRLLSRSDTICFCETPLYVYIQNSNSMCNDRGGDKRGMDEIERYRQLTDYIKAEEPGFYDKFRRIAAMTAIRSSTRMDAGQYNCFVKDERTRSMVAEELAHGIEPEIVFFKILPGMYRLLARTYMKLIFYREGKTF
jgi:glycosyltransferase involved in cell wall biosynthesis